MKLIRIHYLDASAIVKLFITEEGSDRLQRYFGEESNFHATSFCFAEALGALKVKRFYRKEISDEQYFCACEELLAYGADNTIEIEDVEIKDPMVFVEVENLVRKYQETIDVSDAFQIVSVKRNYFSRFECDSKPILITGDKAQQSRRVKREFGFGIALMNLSQLKYCRHNIRLEADLRTRSRGSRTAASQPYR